MVSGHAQHLPNTHRYLSNPSPKTLHLDHVELPYVLDLAVHLVQKLARRVKGIILRLFLLLALFYWSTPSWLKVVGGWGGVGWGGWVAYGILVSDPVLGLGLGTWT